MWWQLRAVQRRQTDSWMESFAGALGMTWGCVRLDVRHAMTREEFKLATVTDSVDWAQSQNLIEWAQPQSESIRTILSLHFLKAGVKSLAPLSH